MTPPKPETDFDAETDAETDAVAPDSRGTTSTPPTTPASSPTPRSSTPLRLGVPVGLAVGALALGALACGGPDVDAGASDITADELAEHTRELSSDRFRGRAPAGPGEEPTLEYLQERFRELGLRPMGDAREPAAEPAEAGPGGAGREAGGEGRDAAPRGSENGGEGPGEGEAERSYLQRVPMVGITADPETARLGIPPSREAARRGELRDLQYGDEFVAWTRLEESTIDVTAPLVFVGYGIDAPEENWDDYGDRDLSGTILVMLVNDPPLDDPERFGGEAMTYYGRWTYKFEEAARQGAVGALLIHTTESAGYPWSVVRSSWSGRQLHLPQDPRSPRPVALEGWLSSAAANDLLASAGHDLLDLARRAERPRFEPVDLGIAATAHLDNRLRRIRSFNVAGAVPGNDPEVADEHVVYTAHWDHFGVGDPVDGDRVYNGALDNATGVAGLLELAEAFAGLEVAPRRSVLFLAVTAEEQGLLGTRHYVQNPTVPLSKTLAAINLDGLNVWGPTRDVTVIGMGKTTLEDRLARILDEAQDGRTLTPDPEPDKGYYYRSDQFPFAQAGVPALYIDDGVEYEGRPEGFADRVREEYLAEHYHQPSDEFSDEWDLSGAELDVRALFRVGFDVAMGETWPTWKEGAEFRAARREMLEGSTEGD